MDTGSNKTRISEALSEFDKHSYGDLIISKRNGVIKSYKINAEVRFDMGEKNGKKRL